MANVLTVPNSGIISFDGSSYSNLAVPPLSTSIRLSYDNGGGLNITSLNKNASASERFSIDGTQGRLFSVTDALTGILFSVNDITGLPILEVEDTDTVIAGEYNSNALVVSGKNVGIGTLPISSNKLSVSGNSTFIGTISTNNHKSSKEWNEAYTFTQTNSSQLIPTNTNYSITTNLDTNIIAPAFASLMLEKIQPVYNFTYVNFDMSIATLSSVGNCYRGSFLINISFANNNHFIQVNNFNYLNGTFFINSSNTTSLTSIKFPDLSGINGSFQIQTIGGFVDEDFTSLQFVNGPFTIGNAPNNINFSVFCDDLADINFPNLEYIGGYVTIGGYGATKTPALSSLSFPKLKHVNGGLFLGGSTALGTVAQRNFYNLQNISFPSLETVNGITITNVPSITSVSFQNLKFNRGNAIFNGCTALREVSFPNLLSIGGYMSANINTNTPSLTSISIPNVQYYISPLLTEWGSSGSLRNFEFGTNTLKGVNSSIFNVNQTLTQQSVDNLLKAFANLDGTNGTIAFGSGRTLSVAGSNSAPSYTGGVTTTSAGTNFVRTGTTVVASVVGHGHTNGDIVTFTGNTQSTLNGTYIITVNNADEFQYTTPTTGNITGDGTVTMRRTTVATDGFRYFQTIALRGVTITITML